jgi:hypothetical protein
LVTSPRALEASSVHATIAGTHLFKESRIDVSSGPG